MIPVVSPPLKWEVTERNCCNDVVGRSLDWFAPLSKVWWGFYMFWYKMTTVLVSIHIRASSTCVDLHYSRTPSKALPLFGTTIQVHSTSCSSTSLTRLVKHSRAPETLCLQYILVTFETETNIYTVCLSVGRSACLSVGQSVCLSVCLSDCLSVCLSVFPLTYHYCRLYNTV